MLDYVKLIYLLAYKKDIEYFVAHLSRISIKRNKVFRLGLLNDWIFNKNFNSKLKYRYYESLFSFLSIDISKRNELYNTDIDQIYSLLKYKHSDFFYDRMVEYRDLTNCRDIQVLTKIEFSGLFTNQVKSTENTLFNILEDNKHLYFLRKMHMPTLNDVVRVTHIIDKCFKDDYENLSVLDYGCGAADTALYLAKKGAKCTICDVKNGNLVYAKKRFDIRNIPYNSVGATADNSIPKFTHQYDVIIALEVIEHLREPFIFLERMKSSLKKNGILILGSFPFTETNTNGDHLVEAVSERENLLKEIKTNWDFVESDPIMRTIKLKN